MHTFYYVAMKQRQNIIKKKEADERFEIAQLTEKALKRHDSKKHHHGDQQIPSAKRPNSGVTPTSSYSGFAQYDTKLGSNMMNLIPGFSIIKNKVITPLLVATERVVDFILPDTSKAS